MVINGILSERKSEIYVGAYSIVSFYILDALLQAEYYWFMSVMGLKIVLMEVTKYIGVVNTSKITLILSSRHSMYIAYRDHHLLFLKTYKTYTININIKFILQ